MKESVFIALGSNLGDRIGNCRRAMELIGRDGTGVRIVRRSSLYETAPWGLKDQPPFVNAVVEVDTELEPRSLLDFLKSVEKELGGKKNPSERWGPRWMDLDIILYGDRIIDEAGLTVPHPLMARRAFVLLPLAEIGKQVVHPVLKKSISALLSELDDKGGVRRISSH